MTLDHRVAADELERGLAASWSRQVRWTPGGVVRHLGGLQVALSAVRDQTQQVAVVEGPVPEPEPSVIAAEVVFDDAGWRPAVDLLAGRHPDIEAVLAARGFAVAVSRPGMVRTVAHDDWSRPSSPARIELGVSRDRDEVIAVQQRAFHLDPDTARGMVPNAVFADPDAIVVVARDPDTGRLVGSVTVHLDGAIAAVVGAAVDADLRRLGIGSALTVAALDVARSHGAEAVWLQATDDGRGLYERLGFETVARCDVWLR